MTTANYYDIFPDKTFHSTPINWPQLIDPQLIDPINLPQLIEPQLIEPQLIDPPGNALLVYITFLSS